jgi:integrase
MRRYSLSQRGSIWYAQIKNPKTKKYLTARSTGQTDRDEAIAIVIDWLRNGINGKSVEDTFTLDATLAAIRATRFTPDDAEKIVQELIRQGLIVSATLADTRGAENFGAFLVRFWTFDKSPFVAEKISFGHSITKNHCALNLGRAKLYWQPFFATKAIADVTMADLKEFAKHLDGITPALAPVTKNHIFTLGRTALAWAATNKIIPNDPGAGVPNFAGESRDRGVLTPDEARQLFSTPWSNELARLANMTAMVTGLRIMEVLSLRVEDLTDTAIFIRRSYSRHDGYKSTKTGKDRQIPIRGELRPVVESLRENAKLNPWNNGMVFWSQREDTPMQNQAALNELKRALVTMKAGPHATIEQQEEAAKYWKVRNITCHSWRHFFSARLSDKADKRQVMLVTGHSNESVFDSYAAHELAKDHDTIGDAMSEVFANILPFKAAQ